MLEKPLLMEMLRRMVRIRRFEERVIQLVERGELVGAAHSYIGEEPVPRSTFTKIWFAVSNMLCCGANQESSRVNMSDGTTNSTTEM